MQEVGRLGPRKTGLTTPFVPASALTEDRSKSVCLFVWIQFSVSCCVLMYGLLVVFLCLLCAVFVVGWVFELFVGWVWVRCRVVWGGVYGADELADGRISNSFVIR